jgi:replicative DNA helicase
MAYHAARHSQVPTAFFSMEQPKEQLVQRLLASVGQINASRLRAARMESQEWERFYQVDDKLRGVPIHIIDKPALTSLEIRSQARRLKSKQGVGLVVVDYLQLARDPKAKSREQEVGGIFRGLKALAKELNLPVIALCQLNREVEKRPNRRPVLSDLRESGSIELDADLVLFIYRDELYREDSKNKGIAEVRLAKHRNGPTGLVNLAYRKEFMLFQNYIRKDERGTR